MTVHTLPRPTLDDVRQARQAYDAAVDEPMPDDWRDLYQRCVRLDGLYRRWDVLERRYRGAPWA